MRRGGHDISPTSGRVAISDAIADVVTAARRAAVERTELVRLELRNDLVQLIGGTLLYGAIATITLGVGLLITALMLFQALATLVPLLVAGLAVILPLFGVGIMAGTMARRKLPKRALEASGEGSSPAPLSIEPSPEHDDDRVPSASLDIAS